MSNSLVLLLIYGWGKWADSRQLFCIKWLQIKPSCTYIRKFCKDDYQNLNFRVSPEELCSTSHSTKFLNGTSLSEWGCPECSAAARSSPGSPSWRGSQLWVIDLLYAHLGWYNTSFSLSLPPLISIFCYLYPSISVHQSLSIYLCPSISVHLSLSIYVCPSISVHLSLSIYLCPFISFHLSLSIYLSLLLSCYLYPYFSIFY